jgi:hypothetical protein
MEEQDRRTLSNSIFIFFIIIIFKQSIILERFLTGQFRLYIFHSILFWQKENYMEPFSQWKRERTKRHVRSCEWRPRPISYSQLSFVPPVCENRTGAITYFGYLLGEFSLIEILFQLVHKNKNALNKFWKKFRRHHQLDLFSFLQTELVLLIAHSSVSRYSRSQTVCVHTCAGGAAVQSKVDAARNATLLLLLLWFLVATRISIFPKLHIHEVKGRGGGRLYSSSCFTVAHMSWPSFAASLVSLAIPRRSRRSRIRAANNFLILRHSSDMRRTNIRMTALLCVICPNGNAALECANITRAESSIQAL